MDSETGDSHFYGTPEETSRLQARVDRFDASAWVQQHGAWGFGSPSRRPKLSTESPAKLHNPYAGVDYAWQLTETLEDFFSRLAPATTDQTVDVPWIFICNPYVSREKNDEVGEFMKGNEDEAPTEKGSQLRLVVQGGTERLELLAELKKKLELSGKSASFVAKELSQEQKRAIADVLGLAHAGKVRTGKWMLFCPPSEVNEVWELVAKATAQNELGIAAKVLPKPQFDDARKDRLICIYTADFQDKPDVGRVLQRLKELKLAEPKQKPIYYKPDIFTYIGLSHGNPWGLAASIYSSRAF